MMNTTASGTVSPKIHVFEKAGLGQAPFKCIGCHVSQYQACGGAPIQPGSSCDYCGTGIVYVFTIASADGKTFKVGCDCVLKTGDAGLRRTVDAHMKAAQHDRDDARIEAAQSLLKEERVIAAFTAAPHPMDWRARQGAKLMDYATWMFEHAGRSGMIKVARLIEGVYFDKPARKPAADKAAQVSAA
jgi:hypothetical protein